MIIEYLQVTLLAPSTYLEQLKLLEWSSAQHLGAAQGTTAITSESVSPTDFPLWSQPRKPQPFFFLSARNKPLCVVKRSLPPTASEQYTAQQNLVSNTRNKNAHECKCRPCKTVLTAY